ncbi:hypothetical protein [uncultured Pseudokineococcus sp.]|uniref:hypothetical protein n=1 Tax=uncultured Pseudokineococcus sp. TaxID=1642928 RepID=UPI0034385EEE
MDIPAGCRHPPGAPWSGTALASHEGARIVTPSISSIDLSSLTLVAWEVRSRARVHGPTRVGCAVLSIDGGIWGGCNVEHRFRSHDVHAEVNALSSMVANGGTQALALLVAAERRRFTPCGACLDWIFELGGPQAFVGFQSSPVSDIEWRSAEALMPFYPS